MPEAGPIPEAIAAYHPDFFPFLIGETMTESTTPTDELDAARDALAAALDAVAEAERVHSAKRAEARTQEALVATLREAIGAGDLSAADRARAEAVVAGQMADEASDLRRVVLARRDAVRAAEARLILAEAVAGIGHMADDEEQARIADELGHRLKLAILPVLRQARERDRANGSAIDRLKPHKYAVPGLQVLGNNPDQPDVFVFEGKRFGTMGGFTVEQAVKRALTVAQADLQEEVRRGREDREQGSGNPDGGRLPLLSPRV